MKPDFDRHPLSHWPLFADLSPAHLAALEPLLRRRRVAAGVNVLSEQQAGDAVHILLTGTVKISADQPSGDEVILAVCGAGEVLGEISAVDGLRHSANVVTLEDSTFLCIECETFCHCLRTIPGMAFNLALLQARRLRRISAQAQMLATLDTAGRLAYQLLAFANDYGQLLDNGDIYIPLRLTQGELAALIGATRVSVNRAMASYRRSHYLSVDGHYRITLHNRGALQKRAK